MRLQLSACIAMPLALLALSAVPARAAESYKTHTTKLFTIALPETFALLESSSTSWTYKSRTGHFVLRVTAYPMSPKPLATVGEEVLKSFLASSQHTEILEKRTTREDERDIFYTVVKSTRTYDKIERSYLTMRLLTSSKTLNKLMSITLSVSNERADEFGKLCEQVLDSLTFTAAKQ